MLLCVEVRIVDDCFIQNQDVKVAWCIMLVLERRARWHDTMGRMTEYVIPDLFVAT